MRVLVFGASGILGQHMLLNAPAGVKVFPFRHAADGLFGGCDLADKQAIVGTVNRIDPDVILNFAGESNTDSPGDGHINIDVPRFLAQLCDQRRLRYVHISSQSVFSGDEAPYGSDSALKPINEYGRQKQQAEIEVQKFKRWTIIRPTFVLGVRPVPRSGRLNPAEQALAGKSPALVSDRWFSPLFAEDAAHLIWRAIQLDEMGQTIHLGIPKRVSRYDIGKALGVPCRPVSHDSFKGIAPRPVDTTYDTATARHLMSWEDGINVCKRQWRSRLMRDLEDKAVEIALFLGITKEVALDRLNRGFGYQHNEVAADFRRAPRSDDASLLEWYRQTESYIWELSAYHADAGFNYRGMCAGIAERLKAAGAERVLCLGDGVGELTLSLREAGFDAVYHDLAGSRTAEFANFRFWRHHLEGESQCTEGWDPKFTGEFDAVCSMDFLEHVTSVEDWASEITRVLKPGGLFCAQNAFGIGSGENGSMPMHLAVNDRFEKDWDPLLFGMGFSQESSNWYRKPVEVSVAA